MKKILFLFAAVIGFAFTACAQKADSKKSTDNMNSEKKILVTYFSATGSTKAIAEKIAEQTAGTLYAITPEQPYSAADLDWTDKSSRCVDEMVNHPEKRPAVKAFDGNINDYDVIFLGYPIWWAVAPTVVNTFIESLELDGKKVIPFATSYSSEGDKSYDELKSAYPAISWGEGWLSKQGSTKGLNEWVTNSLK